jgi:hypothetical protein
MYAVLRIIDKFNMSGQATNSIFTNMFSLLTPPNPDAPWPLSLQLPRLYPLEITGDEESTGRAVITNCPHLSRKYYAKKMCSSCYHKYGRAKRAWACEHKERLHYAKGVCQFCYLKNYYKRRRDTDA